MFDVSFFEPQMSISWLISQYETIKSNGRMELSDKFIPRPDSSVVFNFECLPEIILPEKHSLPKVFLTPVSSNANTLKIEGELDTFVVNCHTSVFSRAFNIGFKPEEKFVIDLPMEIFEPLWNKLKIINSTAERISCFSDFIIKRFPNGYARDVIDRVYFDIIKNCKIKVMAEIAKNLDYSLSRLERNFKRRVGVSLKTLIMISRVSFIFDLMLKEDNFNYHDFIFKANYYDQSHFIKDFKKLTGETPRQFFYNNSELCKILSGKCLARKDKTANNILL